MMIKLVDWVNWKGLTATRRAKDWRAWKCEGCSGRIQGSKFREKTMHSILEIYMVALRSSIVWGCWVSARTHTLSSKPGEALYKRLWRYDVSRVDEERWVESPQVSTTWWFGKGEVHGVLLISNTNILSISWKTLSQWHSKVKGIVEEGLTNTTTSFISLSFTIRYQVLWWLGILGTAFISSSF